jgi:hypothetical protein
MTKRERLYPEIKRLREAEGLMWREIAERIGLALQTVQDYYSDPDGSKVAARKAKTDGACLDCGGRTVGDGSYTPERCAGCRAEYEGTMEARRANSATRLGHPRQWTRERIIAALRGAAVDGYLTCVMYDQAYARAARGTMPSRPIVLTRFNKWAQALDAAGLQGGSRHAYRERLTAESCELAVSDCVADLGGSPTACEYDDWAKRTGAPSLSIVKIRCGSYLGALDAVLEREAVAA